MRGRRSVDWLDRLGKMMKLMQHEAPHLLQSWNGDAAPGNSLKDIGLKILEAHGRVHEHLVLTILASLPDGPMTALPCAISDKNSLKQAPVSFLQLETFFAHALRTDELGVCQAGLSLMHSERAEGPVQLSAAVRQEFAFPGLQEPEHVANDGRRDPTPTTKLELLGAVSKLLDRQLQVAVGLFSKLPSLLKSASQELLNLQAERKWERMGAGCKGTTPLSREKEHGADALHCRG